MEGINILILSDNEYNYLTQNTSNNVFSKLPSRIYRIDNIDKIREQLTNELNYTILNNNDYYELLSITYKQMIKSKINYKEYLEAKGQNTGIINIYLNEYIRARDILIKLGYIENDTIEN